MLYYYHIEIFREAFMRHDLQKEKRKRLLALLENIIIDNPKPVKLLAQEIGISHLSLQSFMKGTRDTSLVTMAKIERYIIDKENNGQQ